MRYTHLESAYVVILAGGKGKRFWPLSRAQKPKQFLRLTGDRSMIQATCGRICPPVRPERVLVVTGQQYRSLVREHLPEIPHDNILGEPVGRSTAASVAWASEVVFERDPEAAMLVLASDHHISNPDVFRAAADRAIRVARERRALVLFGLAPDGPKTQYGYILPETDPIDNDEPAVHRVKHFHEKPPEDVAVGYLAEGPCFWNSGMFAWRADMVLRELRTHAPEVYDRTTGALACQRNKAHFARAYSEIPDISIDKALIQHSSHRLVVDSGIDRIDLGNWATIGKLWPQDDAGNSIVGDTVALDCRNTIQYSENALLTTVSLEDVVVVVTDEIVLVCDRSRAGEIDKIVKRLTASKHEYWT